MTDNPINSWFVAPPPTDERDIVLGQFMAEWADLETQLILILNILIGTKLEIAYTIFKTGFQSNTLSELFKALGEIRLTKSEQQELKSLCKRYTKAATKRNRIVHGIWITDANPTDSTISDWVRICAPVSPGLQKQIHNKFNQKAYTNYRFTLKQILTSCEDIKSLSRDMGHFSGAIMNRLYPGEGLPPELF
jgi:hypothetical protein